MAGMIKRHIEKLPWSLIPIDINVNVKSRSPRNVGAQNRDRSLNEQDHIVEDNEKGDRMSYENSNRFSRNDRQNYEGSQSAQKRLLNLQRKLSTEKHKEGNDRWLTKNERKKNSPTLPPEEYRSQNEVNKAVAEFKIRANQNKQCQAQARLERLTKERKTTASVSDHQLKNYGKREVSPTKAGADKYGIKNNNSSRSPRSVSSLNKLNSSTKDVNKSYLERNLFKRKNVEDRSCDIKMRKVGCENNLRNVSNSENKPYYNNSSKSNINHRLKAQGDMKESVEKMEWEPLTEEHVIAELKTIRNNLDRHECDMDYFCEDMCVDMNIPPVDTVLYVVVDTNVLISNLGLIKRLLNGKIKDFKPVIIIPWQVLKELDYLKKGNSQRIKPASVEASARYASSFLLDNSFKIRCQSQKDSLLKNVDFVIENPDDNIIKCCLQLQLNGHNAVLLTNDHNLCLKCTATQIISISGDVLLKIMDAKEPARSALYEIEKEPKDITPHSPLYIAHQFAETMKEFLSLCIESGFRNRYQFLWKLFVKLAPPWNLDEVLTCACSQWSTITGLENCTDQVAKLKKIKKIFSSIKYNKALNDNDLLDIVQQCDDLITALPTIFQNFVDKMKSSLEQIKTAIVDWKNLFVVWRIARAVACFQLVDVAAKCLCKMYHAVHNKDMVVLSEEEKFVFEHLPPLNEVIVTLEAIICLLNKMQNTPCGETTANSSGLLDMHKCLIEFCSKIKPEYKELELADLIEFNNDLTLRNNVVGAMQLYGACCNYLKEIRDNSVVSAS